MPGVYVRRLPPLYNPSMASAFEFQHRIEFLPEDADRLLREVPAASGVFALRGADASAEPYLTRAADLRRRLRRLLAPPELRTEDGQPVLSRRLNLREKVRWIEWTRTGSEFESVLTLYCASRAAFGAEAARKRLRLHPPYFLRITQTNAWPRVYATNKLSRRALGEFLGPYPSRAAAERHADAVLELFKLRRCYEDLSPAPDHPGCVYGEMGKCLRPCQQACTEADYRAEAERVTAFFATRGESMLSTLAAEREAASEAMDFERAASLHAQWEKARSAAQLADELVRPVLDLRAAIVQKAAPLPGLSSRPDSAPTPTLSSRPESAPAPDLSSRPERSGAEGSAVPPVPATPPAPDTTLDAALFLFERGRIVGPERLSTLGVRAVREQTAVGSSLFAQPLMLAAVPLQEPATEPTTEPGAPGPDSRTREAAADASLSHAMLSPEDRARAVLAALHAEAEHAGDPELSERCDFLSLFRRWYYRPEKQRAGECFLPNQDGSWPVRRILNASARAVLGPPAELAPVDRDTAREIAALDRNATDRKKTRILHEGREGVEREVPVLPKRTRRRGKAVAPSRLADEQEGA